MSWTKEKAEKILKEIRKRVAEDEDFKRRFIKDPKSVIEEIGGEKLPEGFKVKVMEEKEDYDLVVLFSKQGKQELSEEELGKIAGGGEGPVGYWIIA